MYLEHPSYDYLDFTYSSYGEFDIHRDYIRVRIYNFWVLAGFPNYERDVFFEEGFIIFHNVISSKRTISEYIDQDREVMKPSYILNDYQHDSDSHNAYPCYLSGVFLTLNAWVDWDIVAKTITIEVANRDNAL